MSWTDEDGLCSVGQVIALNGFAFGLSLIVAIGAQNAFVLRQGLRQSHVLLVVAVCAASDAALICAGVSGLGVLVAHAPVTLAVIKWAGSTFLLGYAMLALRRAWRGSQGLVAEAAPPLASKGGAPVPGIRAVTPLSSVGGTAAGCRTGDARTDILDVSQAVRSMASPTARRDLMPVLLTCLALTWLNPHVYLDTVLLLGSVAQHSGQRWLFAIGAMAGSVVWFTGLGFGARFLRPIFARPIAWRALDFLIALTMATIAIRLLAS